MIRMDGLATAGVLLETGQGFVFMIGEDRSRDLLSVVRIGGHIEPGEGPMEAAVREAREEAGVDVELISARRTYYMKDEDSLPAPVLFFMDPRAAIPILLSGGSADRPASVLYLARSRGDPFPDAEAEGLCWLSDDLVGLICEGGQSLSDLEARGLALKERKALRRNRLIGPRLQLRFLGYMLANDRVGLGASIGVPASGPA